MVRSEVTLCRPVHPVKETHGPRCRQTAIHLQTAMRPPSTGRIAPCMKLAWSEAR